jgi:sterol desaturase/sphingolipid hydroxylase (fatty acid hydroxylase superfamily)
MWARAVLMVEQLLIHAWDAVHKAAIAVLEPLPFFVLLALAVKRKRLLDDVRRALPESKMNLLIHLSDAIAVAPLLVLLTVWMGSIFQAYALIPAPFWDGLHPVIVGAAAVFLGDFIGYWRHRFEHTPLLWPSHAVHHSDTQMTWLAIFRFHPFNRLTTAVIDSAFILAIGLPPYAVLVNSLVRHNYGAFIHADLPWTYGPFGKVFVSPVMYRWHHAIDRQAYNTNYATVFSLFDRAFGTYRVPGPCDKPLGVPESMGDGFIGQMAHPLRSSSYRYFLRSIGHARGKG